MTRADPADDDHALQVSQCRHLATNQFVADRAENDGEDAGPEIEREGRRDEP